MVGFYLAQTQQNEIGANLLVAQRQQFIGACDHFVTG